MKHLMNTDERIIDYLISVDSDFSKLRNRYGLICHELHTNLYESIIYHIVGQMLSKSAAEAIYKRLRAKCNNIINYDNISSLTISDYKEIGISGRKMEYINEFNKKYQTKEINLDSLINLSDEAVISTLTSIKGIGIWTAEMLSLFSLGRENIFSFNDVALKNGIIKFKKYKTLSKKRFELLRKKYSPFCSYASLYFYRINDDKDYK